MTWDEQRSSDQDAPGAIHVLHHGWTLCGIRWIDQPRAADRWVAAADRRLATCSRCMAAPLPEEAA